MYVIEVFFLVLKYYVPHTHGLAVLPLHSAMFVADDCFERDE